LKAAARRLSYEAESAFYEAVSIRFSDSEAVEGKKWLGTEF
jgi:hypothetical protein